ncbi:MAG: alpha/beta fold hydrolase [Myxococcota bacterium]
MTSIRNGTAPAWGTRSQIGATLQDLKDVRGNRDGIWGNESKPAGTVGDVLDRNPVTAKLSEFVGVGLSTQDEVRELQRFRAQQEASWGQPVTNLDLSELKGGELFAAQKAIALTRLGRTPSDVVDGFVKARGTVDGQHIADRDVFFQRFKPVGTPNGKMVVISPGFQETGRNFHEQIDLLNRRGYDVVVMDHQWAGQTRGGKAGGLDSAQGVARDVAAVTAHAAQLLEKEYGAHAGKELILMGNSMGAGPGVLGALTWNENGQIKLDGPQMPRNIRWRAQAPFLGATPGVINDVLATASRIPMLNKLAAPSAGVPVLTHDPAAAQKVAQGAVAEDVRAQLQAMTAALPGLERILDLIKNGKGPAGEGFMVHGDKDPLADPDGSRRVADWLGPRATLKVIRSNNHVLEQSASEQQHILQGL